MIKPDIENAALKAIETLIKYHVSYAPVSPLPILKSMQGVAVVSYAEMAETIGMERSSVLKNVSPESRDAGTAVEFCNGHTHYIVAYNQQLPTYAVHRALARELGHIILGHDGTLPESVRCEEALTFARHLLFPRPLIRAMQDAGIVLTAELLGTVTGCYERCQGCLRESKGVHVPKELNRIVREQFTPYVENLLVIRPFITPNDHSAPVDFGTYMDHYEE